MKKFFNAYIRFMQRVLITILLSVVYIVFFGLTLVFMAIFKPKQIWRGGKNAGSFWLDSPEEPADMNHASQQS
jgi:hypothetical protein